MKLYALNESGQVLWSKNALGDLALVQNDKYILNLSSQNGWTLLDAATGKDLAAALINPLWLKDTSIPNDPQGGLYISNMLRSSKSGISKVDSKGKLLWTYKLHFPGYSDAYELTSDANGNVFFTDSGGTFYSLDRNGNERFIFLYRNEYGPISTKSVIDKDGNVYALFGTIGLFKISAGIKK